MTTKHAAVALGSGIAAGWLLALAAMYVWLAVVDHHELDSLDAFGQILLGGM
jgi:hypothetical protein